MNHHSCAVFDDSLKIWSPKDIAEVKCVIKNLRKSINFGLKLCKWKNFTIIDPNWHRFGRIGLHAFKSRCLNKFKFCDLAFPRDLEEEFLKLLVPAPKDVDLGPYDGTCLMITYNLTADIKVMDLALREVSCVGKYSAYICEAF
jgi:hypothetical protein